MKRILVSFGGSAYDATLAKIADGTRYGADEVWIFDEPWLMRQAFYAENQWAWQHPGGKLGYGWYIWKPYVILHALRLLQPGDILLWTDADTYPIADLTPIYDGCVREGGMFLFEAMGCVNRQWVKRDIWEAVFPYGDYALDSPHATARFMAFENGALRCGRRPQPADFLAEWLAFCETPGLTTRDPSRHLEFAGFEENRGDQSVFSALVHKYNLSLHREADAFGEASQLDRELYPQLFTQQYCAGDRNDLSGSRYRRGPA